MVLPVNYFDARSSGALVAKFGYDVERLSTATTRSWLNILRDILTVIGLLGYMLYLDWQLTLVFACILPFIAFYLRPVSYTHLDVYKRQNYQCVGHVSGIIDASV